MLEIKCLICYTTYVEKPKGEIMSNLLSAFTQFLSTYFGNILDMIMSVEIILGICFAVLGVATCILARRITRIIRKRNEIDDNDSALVTIKVVGLVFMLVAFLILVLQTLA